MAYDTYDQTEYVCGAPDPELVAVFASLPEQVKVLDLGCGQGRDAVALARLGFTVTGVDNSRVGIEQMNQVAQSEGLALSGLIADIYAFNEFEAFDIILLDSMFHFAKNDRAREEAFLRRIIKNMRTGAFLVVCIQDVGKKVAILQAILEDAGSLNLRANQALTYLFEDRESGHHSTTDYRMIVVEK